MKHEVKDILDKIEDLAEELCEIGPMRAADPVINEMKNLVEEAYNRGKIDSRKSNPTLMDDFEALKDKWHREDERFRSVGIETIRF